MSIIQFFKNSPYFDRNTVATSIRVQTITKALDNKGVYVEAITQDYEEPEKFFSPIKRELIQPQYLEKYNEFNYVYLTQKLDLTSKASSSRVIIDGQVFKVLDYHGRFLDSGFYKYTVAGTGENVS